MRKKVRVVMLASEEINKVGDICLFAYGLAIAGVADIGYPKQRLFFTSDDEILVGDWFIHSSHGVLSLRLCKSTTKKSLIGDGWVCWRDYSSKVIATNELSFGLPLISESFIVDYIKNRGEITLVEIAMEIRVKLVELRTEIIPTSSNNEVIILD